jgi:hypothetical protein
MYKVKKVFLEICEFYKDLKNYVTGRYRTVL